MCGCILGVGACEPESSSPVNNVPAARPTVASLVPAATDLLFGMGARSHVVAVSNYDRRDETTGLPRVGDYQQTDWEKLSTIKPDLMVIQVAPSRLPPGLVQRAESLNMRLVNVQINRLTDIFTVTSQLGNALGQPELAGAFNASVQGQLDEARRAVQGRRAVRVLLCRDETAVYVVGRDNFVDDLLQIAGGENVITGDNPWPSIDREKLIALDPDVIIQLLPDAPPQIVDRAKQTWSTLGELRAVKNGRVHLLTEWYVLQPGAQVGTLANRFAALIHEPARDATEQ